jgi:type II secretory pathway component PulK
MVLVGVMWMLVLMIAILAVGAQSSRLDSRISLNAIEKLRGRWLCRAGVETAIAYLKEDLTDTDSLLDDWAADAENLHEVQLSGGSFMVTIVDECSKLNLNVVGTNQLLALDSEEMNETITDSIQDWRDSDEEVRTNGAESGYYLNLPGGGYLCRNSRYRTPREILRVRGVTEKMFYGEGYRTLGKDGWSRYLTCFSSVNNVDASGDPRVNVNGASEDDLTTKLSITKEQAQWIVQNRPFRSLADLLGGQSGSSGNSSGTGNNSSGASQSSGGGTSMRIPKINGDDLAAIPASAEQGEWAIASFLSYTQPLLLGADANSDNSNADGDRDRPREGRQGRRGGEGRRRTDVSGRGGEGSGQRTSEGGRSGGNRRGGGQGRPGGERGGGAGGARGSSGSSSQSATQLKPLDWATFSRIFDQITLTTRSSIDGVININTVSLEVLRAFLEGNDDLAGKMINFRESMGGEVTNVCDLMSVEGMTQETLKKYIDQFSVRSSVYMIQVTATSSVCGVSYTTEMVVNRDRQGREVLYKLEGVGI